MGSTTTANLLADLARLGREFEQFDGLRPLALADWFHPESPLDEVDLLESGCCGILGNDLAWRGLMDLTERDEVYFSFYRLRERYGHRVWVRLALVAYLRQVKQDAHPETAADSILNEAERVYQQHRAANDQAREIAAVGHVITGLLRSVKDMEHEIERLRGLVAPYLARAAA
ncbi:hypothetical protein MNJPNG_05055 [Cupriavidus oxalaticus]|uniref:hypothetical protein n=1 Tax=Cupriavidus oxalaticus TaxID=96344 RepID=UPI003F735206